MNPPIVNTVAGQVQGKWNTKANVAEFKGVPYAQPPVGPLRWKAPQPAKPWEGVKKTTAYSDSAWQQEISIPHFFEALINGQGWGKLRNFGVKTLLKYAPKPKQSEDCLYLNIKSPSVENTAKLPVMVWIHGGDHQDGSSSEIFYDGVAIPQKDIVLVTINYRLGLMGYFAHPELSQENDKQVSGNYGTLDQITALKWVQENISGFGGDPDNVTIFGESAGGESVAHMLCTPLADGLFHKAIMQSPANGGQMIYQTKDFTYNDAAEKTSLEFTEALGLTGENQLERLRAMPANELMSFLRKQERLNSFYPIIDGYVLPKGPFETFHDGEQNKVPLLVGSNSHEGTCIYPVFNAPIIDYKFKDLAEDTYPKEYHIDFQEDADTILSLYPGLEKRDLDAEKALLGDDMFGAKARLYAEHAARNGQDIYFYQFRRVPASSKQVAGAYHAAELPFVHGTTTPILPLTKTDQVLSKTMIDYWTSFAKTGNPNNSSSPDWEAFDANNPQWMILDNSEVGMQVIDREEKYQMMMRRTLRQIQGMKELEAAT